VTIQVSENRSHLNEFENIFSESSTSNKRDSRMNVLITGGTGYIGSHICSVLMDEFKNTTIIDNLSNSKMKTIHNLKKISKNPINFIAGDVRDTNLVYKTIKENKINHVIHLAGLKSVSNSTEFPIEYYDNNVSGTISLLQAMNLANVKSLVFSSSATVYGAPQYLPLDEAHPTAAINPYGRSKLHIEEILRDTAHSNPDWRIACLRYFNPVGSHESGIIGDEPNGTPQNLMPYLAQVAAGMRPELNIYGNDYNTTDGTGVRDYIHIMDLAEGHIAALDFLAAQASFHTFNLGTGRGYSVLELLNCFEIACGKTIPHRFLARRPGDVAECYAATEKAKTHLGWHPKRSLEEMCESSWNFQKMLENPRN